VIPKSTSGSSPNQAEAGDRCAMSDEVRELASGRVTEPPPAKVKNPHACSLELISVYTVGARWRDPYPMRLERCLNTARGEKW